MFRKESVDKPVENHVDNLWIFAQKAVESLEYVDINRLIMGKYSIFQQIFAEKRYKLIIFAPKLKIVDKVLDVLIIRKKESTSGMDNVLSQKNNYFSK